LSIYYLDTSVLVKLYIREPGTEQMIRLASAGHGHSLAVLSLARVEFRSAIRQRQRAGDVSQEAAAGLILAMENHFQSIFLVQLVNEEVIEQAAALLDRHPLRAYDALQLAGCLALGSRMTELPSFVCSDQRLLRAAAGEGFGTLDPAVEL
jgi:predicted nucleic acid-binding protein